MGTEREWRSVLSPERYAFYFSMILARPAVEERKKGDSYDRLHATLWRER
jgi:hypothetical protein